jgi:hypothetical protein
VICPFCVERHVNIRLDVLVVCVKIDARNIFFTLELPPLCMVTEDEFSCHGINDRKTLATKISVVNPMTTKICFLLDTLDTLLIVATYPMAKRVQETIVTLQSSSYKIPFVQLCNLPHSQILSKSWAKLRTRRYLTNYLLDYRGYLLDPHVVTPGLLTYSGLSWIPRLILVPCTIHIDQKNIKVVTRMSELVVTSSTTLVQAASTIQ